MIDNAEILISQIYEHEPDAIVTIFENDTCKAILFKSDWEDEAYNHIRAFCRLHKAPDWIERGEVPIIGTVCRVVLEEK